jgi:hypothetical protein
LEAALHYVYRLQDKVEIDVPFLGNPVAPVAQLDGVDRLANERPARDYAIIVPVIVAVAVAAGVRLQSESSPGSAPWPCAG